MENKIKIRLGIFGVIVMCGLVYAAMTTDNVISDAVTIIAGTFGRITINQTSTAEALLVYSSASSSIELQHSGSDPSLVINSSVGVPMQLIANVSGVNCTTATEGSIYYDGTLKLFYGCNSTDWVNMTGYR